MSFIHGLSQWAEQRSAWLVLLLSALGLECAALYFQHVLGYAPCIMCIYQRTAMWGIVVAGFIVLAYNHAIMRCLALGLWAYSAAQGFMIASEHVEIIDADDPFFATCEIVPNFPSWAPLHEWLPSIFAAPGDCLENSWQFLSMGMAHWMQLIFAAYFVVFIAVLIARLIDKKAF